MTRKKGWFLGLARWYARRRLRASFAAVRVAGLNELRELVGRGPIIIAPNHVAWWDPFVCVALDEALGGGGHCLMDAANLRNLPFFAWTGALPLDRSSPRAGLKDLVAATTHIEKPGQFLIVFPQGRQRPAHLPLDLQRGIELLAQRTRLPVVPMGLRYDFTEESRPIIHVSCGPALGWREGGAFLGDLTKAIEHELSTIDRELLRGVEAPPSERRFEDLCGISGKRRLPLGTGILARLARSRSV